MSIISRWTGKRAQAAESSPIFSGYLTSDIGCVRDANEDHGKIVFSDDAALAVVADGMGGHSAGEMASKLAVDSVVAAFLANRKRPGKGLRKSLIRANKEIYRRARRDVNLKGMGTTCTALIIRGAEAWMSHVGDSRLYLVRQGAAYLLTEDHSAVMEMVRHGLLSREEARRHEDRNVILRAVGTQARVDVAHWPEPMPVREGDRFVLSSDGLHDLVSDAEIGEIAGCQPPEAACATLISLARDRGGYDNITVGALQVGGTAAAVEPGVTREAGALAAVSG